MKEVIKVGAVVVITGGLITLAAIRHNTKAPVVSQGPSQTQLQLSAANQHISQLEAQVTTVTSAAATQKTDLCTFITTHINTKTTPAPTDCQ